MLTHVILAGIFYVDTKRSSSLFSIPNEAYSVLVLNRIVAIVACFRNSENTDKGKGYITKSRRDLQGRLYRYDYENPS